MARPYSTDLRERVVAAVLAGESARTVAERFGVAVSSVVKWSQRYRRTGSVAPGQMGGHRRPILEPHRHFILDQIERMPHLTLHRLKELLAARGGHVSHNAVWLFLRRDPGSSPGQALDQNQYGAAARLGREGQRIRGFAPHGHWRTMTFLAALRCDGITAPFVLDGAINGA